MKPISKLSPRVGQHIQTEEMEPAAVAEQAPVGQVIAPILSEVTTSLDQPEMAFLAQEVLGAKYDHKQLIQNLEQLSKSFESSDLNLGLKSISGFVSDGELAAGQIGNKNTQVHHQSFEQSTSPLANIMRQSRAETSSYHTARGSIQKHGHSISGYGDADFGAHASLQSQGAVQSALVNARYNAKLHAKVGGEAQGHFVVDLGNLERLLEAQGHAEVGAELRTELHGSFETVSIPFLGKEYRVKGSVDAHAEVAAKASVTIDSGFGLRPPKAVVEGKAGAFAGAKAGVKGTIGVGGFLSVTGEAQAWAGAGAEAGLIAGYEDGKIRFGFSAGAAVGAGAGASVVFEVDVKKMGEFALKAATLPARLPFIIIGKIFGAGENSKRAFLIAINPLLFLPSPDMMDIFGDDDPFTEHHLPTVLVLPAVLSEALQQTFGEIVQDHQLA